jgi:hypothetical protein
MWSDPLGLEGCKIGQPDPASQGGDLGTLADKIAAHGDINSRGIPGVDDLDVPEHLENMMRNSQGVKIRDTPSGTDPGPGPYSSDGKRIISFFPVGKGYVP